MIFNYRIKIGASKIMIHNLKYPEQATAIKDGEICRITDVIPQTKSYLRDQDTSKAYPILYQIAIYGSKNDQEAIIFPELLEELPQENYIVVK